MPPDSPSVPSRISPAAGAFLLEFAENEYVIFRVCVSAANAYGTQGKAIGGVRALS